MRFFPHRSGRAALCAALSALALAVPAGTAPVAADASPRPAAASWPVDAVAGRLLVTLDNPSAALDAAARGLGGHARPIDARLWTVTVPAGRERRAVALLGAVEGVRAVEPDRLRSWAARSADPLAAQQWSHELTHLPSAWDQTVGSRNVRVALIDSGVVGSHPDLRDNIVEQVDLSGATPVLRPLGSDNDTCGIGHGTQVAGILGAVGDNGIGGNGVAWRVGIVDLAVSSTATEGTCEGASDSAILAALSYATTHPDGAVDVVNLSVGGRQAYCPEAYETAVAQARARGVLVVAAAGNSGMSTAQVPASCPGVLAVGAVGADGARAPYSAANPWIDLVAPAGTDLGGREGLILTTGPRGDWVRTQGTSFAAPFVSGTAALLRSLRPHLTPDEIESVLERSADPAGGERSDAMGWGLVRPDRAVSYVLRRQLLDQPVADPWFPVLRRHPRPAAPGPARVAAAADATTPSVQAAEVSRTVFREGGAVHAVLARDDDFADGLAGSALGMGVGPLLFNASEEPLEPQNRKELRRALPEGAAVYVLGGERGVSARAERDLRVMGYEVVRLAGATREETAARVAREIYRIRRRSGMGPLPEVVLVTGADWPDAVAAGQLVASEGTPVLLTSGDQLHAAAADALADLRPGSIVVVGSAGRIPDQVALEAQAQAGGAQLTRLSGATRHETAAEVAREVLRRRGAAPGAVIAVNVGRRDAFPHALSASVLAGAYGGVFVTVDGVRGRRLSEAGLHMARAAVPSRGRPADVLAVAAGGDDVVAPAALEELIAALADR